MLAFCNHQNDNTTTLDTKVLIMSHFTTRAIEYVVTNATHIKLDPILAYARAIARVAGPGTSIYRDILKAINSICCTPWTRIQADMVWTNLVDQLPYADRELRRVFKYLELITRKQNLKPNSSVIIITTK